MSKAAVSTNAHLKIQPGVVTGEAYQILVEACKAGGYALAAVNISGSHTINAVLEAAALAASVRQIMQMQQIGVIALFTASGTKVLIVEELP